MDCPEVIGRFRFPAAIAFGCLLFFAISTEAQRPCTSSEFLCTDGGCVSSDQRCDGNFDCNDRSDENCCDQNSNSGREFVLAFMTNFVGSPVRLFLFLTSPRSLNYSISAVAAGIDQSGFLEANTLVSVELPSSLQTPVGISNNGILVKSSEDMTVYGLNQRRATTDAFLALPTNIQGHEYLVGSFTQRSTTLGGRSLLAVVGIHDNTTVTVEVSSSASDGSRSLPAGQNSTYVLNRFETLTMTGLDMTGSRVFSDKTISVFGGHECAFIPVTRSACDHLVEQMPPVTTLGRHFATVPLATRTGGDTFRAVAYRDGTDIHINGVLEVSALGAGKFHEFDASSSSYLFVEASRPILLLQYSKGTTVDGVVSDPFMSMIPPIEQYRTRYVVSTPAASPVAFTNYLSLVAPSDQLDGLRLDDAPLPSSILWNSIPGQTLMGTSIPIAIGSHAIHHVERAKFGLSSYGFARADSYGYPGGLQLQAQCSLDPPTTTDIDECQSNGGRGPCQHQCLNTFGSFLCSCNDGFVLQPDRLSCGLTSQPCRCSANGICRSGGLCECHPGWGGPTCSEPQCHLVNDCSGRGTCIAPNTCRCERGWAGFACAVDACPQRRSCTSCTAIPECGWCESQRRCLAGTGFGPFSTDTSCPAWFFYHCVTVTPGSGSDLDNVSPFSVAISVISCGSPCINTAVAHRGNSLQVPGSQIWCDRYQRACQNFDRCFDPIDILYCTGATNFRVCRIYSEDKCPGGFPQIDVDIVPPTSNTTTGSGNDVDFVATTIDFSFHIRCATSRDPVEWSDYGCYCAVGKPANAIALSPRLPVDGTDSCCQNRDSCYASAPAGCSCLSVAIKVFSASCDRHRGEDFCQAVSLGSNEAECQKYCCQCDLNAAKCLAQQLSSKRNDLWSQWLDVNRGACTTRCGTATGCPCDRPCSGNGVMEGIGKDAFCLCFPGWKGQCCDQTDCGCTDAQGRDCFGNGICLTSFGDFPPRCSCLRGWGGRCCDRRVPVRRFGDPHLSTADGFEFDYFGIGEFWDCISTPNNFGVQIRFFKYRGTSFTGAVAVKTGNVTTTIYTLNNTAGEDSLPRVRINGTLLSATWSDYPGVHFIDSDSIKLYVQPIRSSGSVVRYLFQFDSGTTYSVDVRYSSTLERQYMDTEFGPVASFLQQTKGLCGFMDNNVDNDLIASDGVYTSNTTLFSESWRVDQSAPNTGDGSWSWSYSNFHPDDPLDSSYTDPDHRPVYGTAQLDATSRMEAEDACGVLQLEGTLLDNCILDFGLTKDETVIQQEAFQRGKCLNDCSNRGRCNNGTCICTSGWEGADCSTGGCGDCPSNSQCMNGFCRCNFGFTGPQCEQATCEGVNNCTDPTHGLCKEPDVCECNPGFIDADCGTRAVCSHNCSNHGTCLGGEMCLCDFGWGGSTCDTQTCEREAFCNDHGQCKDDGTCDCDLGWRGSACDLFSCDDLDGCSGNGECVEVNTCQCFEGYRGGSCDEIIECPAVRNCSQNGVCVDNSTCLCFGGYFGNACDQFECTEGCSGRGTCEGPNICSCILGWTGFDCSEPSCEQLHFCSGNGQCIGPQTCACDDNWTGALCNIFTCTSDRRDGNCSNHGECTAPGECTCDSGFCGHDCQFSSIDECAGNGGSGPCDHICTDTCESHDCSCRSGYILQGDGRSCQDIDECNTTAFSIRLNNCEHQCINTPGSFHCQCRLGYTLGVDGGSCNVTPCDDDHFMCGGGSCIIKARRCDGVAHCDDGSDEEDCDVSDDWQAEMAEYINHFEEWKAGCG